MTSFTCTACIFPTESEARALAKERQKKDNHNLSKLALFTFMKLDIGLPVTRYSISFLEILEEKLASIDFKATFYGRELYLRGTKVYKSTLNSLQKMELTNKF